MDTPLQIAIDGPVAAGKGDIAARLAKELHLLYIYTGAMYRMLALSCIQHDVSRKDAPRVIAILKQSRIELAPPDPGSGATCRALLNGVDVTERIVHPDTAEGASDVSIIPEVRKIMVQYQQELAKGKRVVMEGRDIGLRVLPNAEIKIYLTASVEERVKRRMEQWKKRGIEKTYDEVLTDTKYRDKQDSGRITDPLVKLPDAWELDTTKMTQDEVVAVIITELKKRKFL